jgi:hypothetical protein
VFQKFAKASTILHVGSAGTSTGFLLLSSEVEHSDYHKNMNPNIFEKRVKNQLLPFSICIYCDLLHLLHKLFLLSLISLVFLSLLAHVSQTNICNITSIMI